MAEAWTFDGSDQSATEIMRANASQQLSFSKMPPNENGPCMWLGDQIIHVGDTLVRGAGGSMTIKKGR